MAGEWSGVSFDQFHALTKRAQQRFGLFADQWIIGGGALYNCNQDLSYWRPIIDQLVDSVLESQTIDYACVGWQLDQLFGAVPGNQTIEVIAYIANKLPSAVPLCTHWMNDALAWWKTGGEVWTDPNGLQPPINVHDRFSWWIAMQPYLTGAHYQGNTTMARTDPGVFQGHLRDTLNPFNDGRMGRSRRRGFQENFRLNAFELTAQDQFDGGGNPANICSELEGDGVGFILTCTKGDNNNGGVMSGYGNGARMPDGSKL